MDSADREEKIRLIREKRKQRDEEDLIRQEQKMGEWMRNGSRYLSANQIRRCAELADQEGKTPCALIEDLECKIEELWERQPEADPGLIVAAIEGALASMDGKSEQSS